MDLKKEHSKARLNFQSRLTELTEAWKDIPSDEIPDSIKDFAKFLKNMDHQLNSQKVLNEKTSLTLRRSEDLWLLDLISNWVNDGVSLSDQEKKEFDGLVGAIRLAMQFFVVNVIFNVDNTGLPLEELSSKLKAGGTIIAEQSKLERRLRDMENELGFLVALGVESSVMPKGDLRHLPTDLDRESFSNEIYNAFKERRTNDKLILSRKRKDQLR